MNDVFFYSETRTGSDGNDYNVRYALTEEEFAQLKRVGIIDSSCSLILETIHADLTPVTFEFKRVTH